MIEFTNLSNKKPFTEFKKFYQLAEENNQENIEAISISSFSKDELEVNSRYVNLKIIDNEDFIFFSNYNSPKAQDFSKHNQITALLYWNKINIQVRIKAIISKTSKDFNNNYFKGRSKNKNALAISSMQSKKITSYDLVQKNYENSLKNNNLSKCPEYWGGYSFSPYYFEFWEGHESRVNKREVFNNIDGIWKHSFLQP